MGRFYVERAGNATSVDEPEMIKPFLGAAHHWKAGRSAQELSTSWMAAVGLPERVAQVLAGAPEWSDCTPIQGFFEHQTPLDERGGPSQTDLLAVCALPDGLGVIGVEGKVDEDFGELAGHYKAKAVVKNPSSGVPARLALLCERLAIEPGRADGLRYQLLHRTVATLVEATRYRARQALMLVHSFAVAPQDDHFADFAAFAQALGVGEVRRNGISAARNLLGQSLRLAWVSDTPRKPD